MDKPTVSLAALLCPSHKGMAPSLPRLAPAQRRASSTLLETLVGSPWCLLVLVH